MTVRPVCLLLGIHFLSSFFFFSSRRRHTRYIGDWSSDVCSSDLNPPSQSIFIVELSSVFFSRVRCPHLTASAGQFLFRFRRALMNKRPSRQDNHRSEERRVGKECRSWRRQDSEKTKQQINTSYAH